MLNKMSTRQKTRAALAILGLPADEKDALDNLIKEYAGHPIVGALTGTDLNSVEAVVEHGLMMMDGEHSETFSAAAKLLKDSKIRNYLATNFVKLVSQQDPTIQKSVVSVMSNLSEMDIPEFQGPFEDVTHFISDGLLVFLATTQPESLPSIHICADCGFIENLD